MSTALPNEDLAVVREMLDELVARLDEAPPEDAATVELAALEIQAPFAWPHAPPELARELPDALGRRGDPLAAGLLVAIERLAPAPLAGFAAEPRARLEAAGVEPVWSAEVGRLRVNEASVLVAPGGEGEVWHAVLQRPGSAQAQALVVSVHHQSCGAVIVNATLGEPVEPEAASGLLRGLDDGRGKVDDLGPAELTRRLRSALDHMERHDVPLDGGAAMVLPLLERALTGHAGRFPRPPAGEPEDEDDVLRDDAEALVESFAEWLDAAEPALRDHGPFVVHCMLDWKIGYADGLLERWTLGDLRELLLDWFPRKVTVEDETIDVAADAVVAFLRFLEAEELLDTPIPLGSLEAAVSRLRPRFEAACREPSNWGLAKRMAAEMIADGVDVSDRAAVEHWIGAYNARAAIAARPSAPPQRRTKRRAARQARKRNRR